ncbi:hypothetical protein ABZX85_32590 [Streptomyces sp. NPDC004539]|uniref:hypothetical protein n=1 Tax=Streptomyces sp. NPDC004539 TaxID=3154280 RepID=UPI00339F7F6B
MTAPSTDPFSPVGDPAVATLDERRGLLAVAGLREYGIPAPVAVFDTSDLSSLALTHSRFPVWTLAFHPRLPLLAVGTGRYDGGYFFDGQLLLLHLGTGETRSLIEHELGRQVLELEWVDEHALRILMAPPDDWQDEQAHVEGNVAMVRRNDWSTVPPRSLTGYDLAGPTVPAPRPDNRETARRTLAEIRRVRGC